MAKRNLKRFRMHVDRVKQRLRERPLAFEFALSLVLLKDFAFGPYQGKGTGEISLLRKLWGCFQPGDVALGDKYYCSYQDVWKLVTLGVHVVVKHFDYRTTLTEVARRAGVSRMTIYRTWSDMPQLLGDLMTREWQLLLTEVPPYVGGAEPGASQIADGVLRVVEALRGNHLFTRILELDPELLTGPRLDLEVAAPGAEAIREGLHLVAPDTDLGRLEGPREGVVAEEAHIGLVPAGIVGAAVADDGGELLVALAEDVGSDDGVLADHRLGRVPGGRARTDVVDDDAADHVLFAYHPAGGGETFRCIMPCLCSRNRGPACHG